MKNYLLSLAVIAPLLSGCVSSGNDVYDANEVGQSSIVEFGTVLQARPVTVKAQDSGVGTIGGGVAGAGLGSAIGGGNARIFTGIAGALAGAVAGTAAEQQLMKSNGLEYTIALEKGKVITVVQKMKKEDPVFAKGTRVMVQTSGSYQRVLSADNMPTSMNRPKGIKMAN